MATDPRVVATLSQLYPQIPRADLERIIIIAQGFAASPPPQSPRISVAPPTPPAVTKRGRGRPSKPSPKHRAARGARPAAVAGPAGDASNAERARQVLRASEPRGLTMPEVEEQLHLQEGHGYPLLARIGAKPVGEVELEDGAVLKTYGLPEEATAG